MEIYLDVLIIENFIIDLFLLLITSKILRIKCSNRRLILAAIVGSIYSLVLIIPGLQIFSKLLFQLLVAYLMLFITINKSKYLFILKGLFVYLLLSMTLSGICFAIFLSSQSFNQDIKFSLGDFSYKNLILAMMILYFALERTINYLKDRTIITSFIYDIEMSINGTKFYVKGFLDTGNELREPITNLPCIIVENRFISSDNLGKEKYYIPYKAIGYSGKLVGFNLENVRIKSCRDEWKEIKAIVCPCSEVLSRENEFNALLSRGVI